MLFTDIGEGSSALYCLTDRELCCSIEAGMNRGQWQFPYGVDVVPNDRNSPLYFKKGFSLIYLNRMRNAMPPTGPYRCLIPNSRDTMFTYRTLRIGIYSNVSQGELHESLTVCAIREMPSKF